MIKTWAMLFRALPTLGLLFALGACDPSQPNHLGNPLLWPGGAIGTGVENTFYNARRNRVSAFVRENYADLVADIQAGNTTLAYAAMDIARVPQATRPVLFEELRSNPDLYLSGDPEKLVVALMVYGN